MVDSWDVWPPSPPSSFLLPFLFLSFLSLFLLLTPDIIFSLPFLRSFLSFPLFPSWDVWPLPSSHQSFLSPSFPPSPSFLSFPPSFPTFASLPPLSQPRCVADVPFSHFTSSFFPHCLLSVFLTSLFHILTPGPLPQVVPFSHPLLSFTTFHPLNVS